MITLFFETFVRNPTVCNSWWSRDSFSEIISLIVELGTSSPKPQCGASLTCTHPTVIVAFVTSIAFAFYRQCLDPSFSRSRAPQPQTDASPSFPEHYNPPFIPYDNSTAPAYAPPAGPPPDAFGKPPVYSGQGYGIGMGDKGAAMSDEALKGDDPFADFDASVRDRKAGESRDTLV